MGGEGGRDSSNQRRAAPLRTEPGETGAQLRYRAQRGLCVTETSL